MTVARRFRCRRRHHGDRTGSLLQQALCGGAEERCGQGRPSTRSHHDEVGPALDGYRLNGFDWRPRLDVWNGHDTASRTRFVHECHQLVAGFSQKVYVLRSGHRIEQRRLDMNDVQFGTALVCEMCREGQGRAAMRGEVDGCHYATNQPAARFRVLDDERGFWAQLGKLPQLPATIARHINDLAADKPGTQPASGLCMKQVQGPMRVLVVDDEALIRWAVNETLTEAGHQVVQAADARSALRVLNNMRPPVDVVLLDLRLPDCSDLTLLSTIRTISPDSAVVLMSAHASADVAEEARALGAFKVLPKPFDVDGCEQTLRQACSAARH